MKENTSLTGIEAPWDCVIGTQTIYFFYSHDGQEYIESFSYDLEKLDEWRLGCMLGHICIKEDVPILAGIRFGSKHGINVVSSLFGEPFDLELKCKRLSSFLIDQKTNNIICITLNRKVHVFDKYGSLLHKWKPNELS